MLMPNGRIMVNCGAATKELSDNSEMMQLDISKRDDPLELNATINALCKAFPEQVGYLNSIYLLCLVKPVQNFYGLLVSKTALFVFLHSKRLPRVVSL